VALVTALDQHRPDLPLEQLKPPRSPFIAAGKRRDRREPE
jgi:hypothetical protein